MRRTAAGSSVPDLRPATPRRCAIASCRSVSPQTTHFQVEAGNHALRQLLQLRACQHVAQFGLANQDDLQQLAFAGFQIGQQPQLRSNTSDDRFCASSMISIVLAHRVGAQQELVEPVQIGLDNGVGRVQVFTG